MNHSFPYSLRTLRLGHFDYPDHQKTVHPMIKKLLLLIFTGFLSSIGAQNTPPNIILYLADDM
ncbi:MAG: hypothetical protein KI786_13950, partial [Mameliella sp.]|nr:hypothetical protein [Phaeodactylibacter sp.]